MPPAMPLAKSSAMFATGQKGQVFQRTTADLLIRQTQQGPPGCPAVLGEPSCSAKAPVAATQTLLLATE